MADDFVAHDCGWTGTLQAFVDALCEKLCPVNNTACAPQVCAPGPLGANLQLQTLWDNAHVSRFARPGNRENRLIEDTNQNP
jgi:hypothetical protein